MSTNKFKFFEDNFKRKFPKLRSLSVMSLRKEVEQLWQWQRSASVQYSRDNAHVAVDMPQRQRVARRLRKESNHSPDSPMCSKPHQPRWENSTPETERNYWGVDDSPQHQQTPEADLESSGADTDNQGTGTEADLESSGADTDNQGTGTPPPIHNQGGGGGDNQDTGTPPLSPRHNQGRGGGGNRWTSSSTITTIFMTFPTMLILYVISKDGRALSKDTRYEWTPYAVMGLANAALISMMIGLCSSSTSWLFKCFKWIGIVLFFCALYIMQLPVLVT